jgi:hypothetical protein
MATVKVDLPNRPKGSTVEVPYLGRLVNGEDNEVDERSWERYKKRNPKVEGDSLTISPEVAAEEVDALQEARDKPLDKLTKTQLELIAEAESVDLSEAQNNDDRVKLIEAARNPQE